MDRRFGGALLAAAVVDTKVGQMLPNSISFGGWVAGMALFGGLSAVSQKFYGGRVAFNRICQTR